MSLECESDRDTETVSMPINTAGAMSDFAGHLAEQFRSEQARAADSSQRKSLCERQRLIVEGFLADRELVQHEAARILRIIDATNESVQGVTMQAQVA